MKNQMTKVQQNSHCHKCYLFTPVDHPTGFPKQLIEHPHLILGVQSKRLAVVLNSSLLLPSLGKQVCKQLVEGGGGGALKLPLQKFDGSHSCAFTIKQFNEKVDCWKVASRRCSLKQ